MEEAAASPKQKTSSNSSSMAMPKRVCIKRKRNYARVLSVGNFGVVRVANAELRDSRWCGSAGFTEAAAAPAARDGITDQSGSCAWTTFTVITKGAN